jgi:hypothetical protein
MRPGSQKHVELRGRGGTSPASLASPQEAPGIFSAQFYGPGRCDAILRQVRRAKPWHAARVSLEDGNPDGVVLPATRSAFILGSKEKRPLFTDFEQKVRSIVSPLIRELWGVNLTSCDGTQLIRYKPGGLYVPHKDSSDEPGEISFSSRYFTVLCYLNSNFEGGKTDFPSLGYAATPHTGKALIFPSNYTHSAVPVSAGEKFVLISWLCGPVPLRWI